MTKKREKKQGERGEKGESTSKAYNTDTRVAVPKATDDGSESEGLLKKAHEVQNIKDDERVCVRKKGEGNAWSIFLQIKWEGQN